MSIRSTTATDGSIVNMQLREGSNVSSNLYDPTKSLFLEIKIVSPSIFEIVVVQPVLHLPW